MAKSFLHQNNRTRGIRNNNPGNLRYTTIAWEGKVPKALNKDWKGTPGNIVKEFEQFYELRWGIRAKMRDIITDIKRGTNTIATFITAYAPPHENDTAAYIAAVVRATGIPSTMKLEISEDLLILLCKIIAKVENGADAALITDSDYKDALDILGVPGIKKKVATTTC